jgi:hypothetical protein
MNIAKLAPWLLIAATLGLMAATPQAFAAPGSISFTAPDFAWQYSNMTGTTYIKGNCSFNTMSSVGTGGLFDFSGFYWDTGAVTFGRFGFGCDSLGKYMNITAMTPLSVTVYLGPSDCTGRLWCPDRSGGLESVVGASTYSWDTQYRILTVTRNGPPGSVTATWYAPLVNPSNVSTGVADAARLLASLLPLIMLFLVLKNPRDYKIIISVGVTCLVIVVLAGIIFGMGF